MLQGAFGDLLKRKWWLVLPFFFFMSYSFGTHNRAGEITYEYISGYTFRITITTYTRIGGGVEADRDTLKIDWGQGGDSAKIPRTLKEPVPFSGGTIQKNQYSTEYTFTGPGRYVMVVVDPNRNADIENIPNSVDKPFCLKSELRIDPWGGFNSSVQFRTRSIEFICRGEPWYYNPGAYDVDDDSLVYSLVPCLGGDGLPLPGYVLPHKVANLGTTFEINSSTGDIFWDKPMLNGEYNIAVLVEEYDRKSKIKKGEILRDIQITVADCIGSPPEIFGAVDTCIEAGDTLNMKIWSTDPDGDSVSITYSGTPFDLSPNKAKFIPYWNGDSTVSSGFLNWETNCNNIRKNPYTVYFTSIEAVKNKIGYSVIKRMNITVVGPPPRNPMVFPKGNTMNLSWTKPRCANAIGYKVYHRVDSSGFIPGYCELGVPSYTGYKLVGSTNNINDTTFIHSNVSHGQRMCYLVTAVYAGGIEGYASEEFCSYLKRDVPIITNVSVNITNELSGSDSIKWVNPIELDTVVAYPGPYFYKLYQGTGFNEATNLIFTTPISGDLYKTQTTFRQDNLNTSSDANVFKLELYSGNELVGSSQVASSVFLTLEPDDNQLLLKWTANIGWVNYQHVIYRKKQNDPNFLIVDTVSSSSYLDTGLVNSETYCYFVKTIGKYSLDKMPNPLINFSQEACGIPVDLTPPCPPTLAINPNCEITSNFLTWSILESCGHDVEYYNVYHRPGLNGPFTFVKSIFGKYNTEYLDFLPKSIAGCYYVTAVDSINGIGNRNESLPSNIVCVDNCPEYELPNVFTPNGDGINDMYIPIKNKFIESVEFIVYNRWGTEVFKTTNPELNWDGKVKDEYLNHSANGTDGVYYYVCRYNAITLGGIKSDELKGFIHMFLEKKEQSN